MKKTYFAAIAVALAVLIAGCDGFTTPTQATGNNGEGLTISFRTSDGSITSDGSRALTKPIAAAGADFYEVVFDNGTKKVRTSWGGGRTGKIIPGDGNYDNSSPIGDPAIVGTSAIPNTVYGKAYIFAGRNGTLLGVGVLLAVNNNDGTTGDDNGIDTYIDMNIATEVVFEITALNTDIGGLLNPANPPALATDPPNSDPAKTTFQLPAAGGAYTGLNVGTLTLDETQDPPLKAPVFSVDPNKVESATFDITNSSGISLDSTDINSVIIAASATTGVPATERNRVISNGFVWEAGGSPFGEVTGVVGTLTLGQVLPIPIPLTITTGPKVGLSRISIEIPVFLYSNDPLAGIGKDRPTTNGAKPVTWYIRGGLNNTAVDQGSTANDGDGSMGGAILIGVGDFNKNAAGLVIFPGSTN